MVDTVGILIEESSTTTGTGNFTIAAKNSRRTFNQNYGTGGADKFFYFILNREANEWEHGTGHLLNATTLVRDTVLLSNNADALVNFSAGTKDVVSDRPADLPLVVGNLLFINEVFVDSTDYTAGTSNSITLASTPIDENALLIFFEGVVQHTTDYSLAGSVVTFSATIPSEVLQIEVKILEGGGILTEKFISSDQTITPAGPLTLPHGLSAIPETLAMRLINQTGEFGYSPGDIVTLQDTGHGAAINKGVSIITDSTNIVLRFASDTGVFNIINATTGDGEVITDGNWKLRVTAWV